MIIFDLARKYLKKRSEKRFRLLITKKDKFGTCILTDKEKRFCIKNGFSIDEYADYRANGDALSNYISTLDSYIPRSNNGNFMIISDNKVLFPYVFGKYFKVASNFGYIKKGKIIPLNGSGLDEFTLLQFLEGQDLIIKPAGGYDGQGIYKLHFNSETDELVLNDKIVSQEKVFGLIKSLHNGIIQEKFNQNEFFNQLYPGSVNTVRIISAKTREEPEHEVLCAVQRIGTDKSAPADNFAKGGLSAKIDLGTGQLLKATTATSVDAEGKRIFYEKHPDTGAIIYGKTIPHWEEIKSKIKNFTNAFPFYNFIAWDICLDEQDNIILIETNMKSSLNLFQVHGGLKGTKLDHVIQSLRSSS